MQQYRRGPDTRARAFLTFRSRQVELRFSICPKSESVSRRCRGLGDDGRRSTRFARYNNNQPPCANVPRFIKRLARRIEMTNVKSRRRAPPWNKNTKVEQEWRPIHYTRSSSSYQNFFAYTRAARYILKILNYDCSRTHQSIMSCTSYI